MMGPGASVGTEGGCPQQPHQPQRAQQPQRAHPVPGTLSVLHCTAAFSHTVLLPSSHTVLLLHCRATPSLSRSSFWASRRRQMEVQL